MIVIIQDVGAVTIILTLAQRNRTKKNFLRDRHSKKDELDTQQLSDNKWVNQ